MKLFIKNIRFISLTFCENYMLYKTLIQKPVLLFAASLPFAFWSPLTAQQTKGSKI